MNFKFKWVDDEGNEQGFLSKRGHFDGEILVLDDVELPAAVLADVDSRGNRLIVTVIGENDETTYLIFAVTSGSVLQLKAALGRARSEAWSAMHREELEKEGRGGEFRQVVCPQCHATLDLTGMPDTEQVYCSFCNTISLVDSPDGTTETEIGYGICEECGMYSKPRQFTIFYFYFAVVVYGVWSKKTWRCPACMRPEAWKMLFGNLLFVIGVPVAIVQLFRSYGGTDMGGPLSGLDAANLKARRNNLTGAIEDYRNILQQHPTTAGVKYNLGLAFLHDDDQENASRSFEFSLKDCSNYQPAAAALASCYEHIGETDKLKDLQATWGMESEDENPNADVD